MTNHDHHDHDHDHDHADPGHSQYHLDTAAMTKRVNGLIAQLEAKGVLTEAEVDQMVEDFLVHAKPSNGARVVARAWLDPAFRARLLEDGNAAIAEIGIDTSRGTQVKLRAVENTDAVHNVIVCTLCSCYPMSLLGPPPTWYKKEAYRSRVVREPRAVLREFGLELPPEKEVRVYDSTAELRYLVVPQRPVGTEGLGEEELMQFVPRDALIGVAEATSPTVAAR